jgi:hypothetical protein
MDVVEVELSRIIINERSDHQIIVLKERYGQRSFPIGIGIVEICAIDRRLKGVRAPRPLTHDLLGNVLEKMGAGVEKVVINDLRNHTFYATIYIRFNAKVLEIDSRPSDAIALGVATCTPIFVAEKVLAQVCQ